MPFIQPQTDNLATSNWPAIATALEPYGAPGHEILLRAETIDYLNKKDWVHFVPTATEYLDQYGGFLPATDRQAFTTALHEHTNPEMAAIETKMPQRRVKFGKSAATH